MLRIAADGQGSIAVASLAGRGGGLWPIFRNLPVPAQEGLPARVPQACVWYTPAVSSVQRPLLPPRAHLTVTDDDR